MRLEYGSPFPEGDRERQQRRAQEMGMAFVDLDRVRPDQSARESISPLSARELHVLPVKRDGATLWVALAEPSVTTLEDLEKTTGLRIIPVLCTTDALDDALATL